MAVCYCYECKNVFITRNENENVAVCPKCGKSADILSESMLKERRDDVYLSALHKKQIALYPRDLEEAKEIFLSLKGYRDCPAQVESCEYLAKRLKERERAEDESRVFSPKKIKKALKITLVTVVSLAILISAVLLLASPVKYFVAKKNFENENYEKAAELFAEIPDFGDSRDYLTKIYTSFSEKEGKYISCSALEPWFEVNSAGAITFIRSRYVGDGSITVPAVFDGIEVDAIATNAFKNYTALVSVEIPSSVVSINAYAFYGCKNLESITLPDDLRSISHYAFKDCSSLRSINIPSKVTVINSNTFAGCSKLEFPALPENLTKIDTSAFMGCAAFENVTLPKSITELGQFAFSGCSALTEITFSPSITKIGENTFYNCDALKNVKFMGSHAEYTKINVGKGNEALNDAIVEYAIK